MALDLGRLALADVKGAYADGQRGPRADPLPVGGNFPLLRLIVVL
jgi:hypothetical protein